MSIKLSTFVQPFPSSLRPAIHYWSLCLRHLIEGYIHGVPDLLLVNTVVFLLLVVLQVHLVLGHTVPDIGLHIILAHRINLSFYFGIADITIEILLHLSWLFLIFRNMNLMVLCSIQSKQSLQNVTFGAILGWVGVVDMHLMDLKVSTLELVNGR
jgi:hypothetical protein